MTSYDIKRLALILAIQAEIDGMKIANKISSKYDIGYYFEDEFIKKANEIRDIANKHDEQL